MQDGWLGARHALCFVQSAEKSRLPIPFSDCYNEGKRRCGADLGTPWVRRALRLEKKMDERWLTVEELSREYRVSIRTIYSWVKNLGLPQIKLGKKLRRYSAREVSNFFMEF